MTTTYLCTLDEARMETISDKSEINPYLIRRIPEVSERFCKEAGKKEFEPLREQVTITPRRAVITAAKRLLKLPMPLLELESVTVNGTALDLETDVILYPIDSPSPAWYLQLTESCRLNWYGSSLTSTTCADDPKVVIVGWWGWRSHYGTEGYQDLDVVTGGIDVEVDEITVGESGSFADDGFHLFFSPGLLVRADDELMRVTSVNAADKKFKVDRGVRGTLPTAHDADTPIRAWSVEPDVKEAIARSVSLKLQRKGVFDSKMIDGVGVVTSPTDLPKVFYTIASKYAGY